MTEKEKMIKELPYLPWDLELTKDRLRVKKLCKTYNNLDFEDTEERKNTLKEIFNTKIDGHIEPNFWCDYGYNISFGKGFYANHNLTILDCAKVTFGDNVLCGPNVQIYTVGHPLDAKTRNTGVEFAHGVKIGDNVWIGGGAIILPGITVGNDVVIGAGSIVTKDIPSKVVVGGNPAKILKRIGE